MSDVEFFKESDFEETQFAYVNLKLVADIANRIIKERGVRVWGEESALKRDRTSADMGTTWMTKRDYFEGEENWTHTALLIDIRPIVRESEERQLLREMLELEQSVTWRMPAQMIDRARKLLKDAK